MPKEAKERFCCYCGKSMGFYADYDRNDTCGERECDRYVQDCNEAERHEAHERLDQELGYGNW